MMKKFLTPLCLGFLLAAFAGCSSANNTMVGLKIELTRITRTADGGTQVSWSVVNPNVFSYLVAQTSHRIYLDGVLIGTVKEKEAVAVPAQNRADRTNVLDSAGPAAERALAAAATAGSGTYRVESYVMIRLYGDTTDQDSLTATGTVPVTAK